MKKLLIMTAVVVFISTTVGCNCFPRLFRRGAAYEGWGTNYGPACCAPCDDTCGTTTIMGGGTEIMPIPSS
ncbi:MAG: hypothetical protein HQ567_01450 [Candidatus Nealsonbacteria bacterium]|nr:hypothetical protein [Candidatus Nealsonbacteria bacterium]